MVERGCNDLEGSSVFTGQEFLDMWFARVFCFLRLDLKNSSPERMTNLRQDVQLAFSAGGGDRNSFEVYFIQYFDLLGDEELQIDKIGEQLTCLRFQ